MAIIFVQWHRRERRGYLSYSKSIQVIEINLLREHPGNPNVMDKNAFGKLVRHIKLKGNYEPVVVRVDPVERGCYQILNGHHRVKALNKLGYSKVDCVVWDVDDDEALVLLATLNRLGGKDDVFKKSDLIKSLTNKMSVEEIVKALPETKRSVERLSALKKFRPGVLNEPGERVSPLVFFVNQLQRECIEESISLAITKYVDTDCENKRAAALVEILKKGVV